MEFDSILSDLETEPSRTHNMFKKVLVEVLKQKNGNIERFLDECAAYLVSITNGQRKTCRCPHCQHVVTIWK